MWRPANELQLTNKWNLSSPYVALQLSWCIQEYWQATRRHYFEEKRKSINPQMASFCHFFVLLHTFWLILPSAELISAALSFHMGCLIDSWTCSNNKAFTPVKQCNMRRRDRIMAQIWGFWQIHSVSFSLFHHVLREQKCRLCGNSTCNFIVNRAGFKISPFASLQLKCLCGNCISTWAPGSHQLSLLDEEETAATGDGVSHSDPPYLLYHLSTACWIVAALLFSFFLRLHASFKPAFNSNIHFYGGKKCSMIWNWMISLHPSRHIFWKLSGICCHFYPARDWNLWKGKIKGQK